MNNRKYNIVSNSGTISIYCIINNEPMRSAVIDATNTGNYWYLNRLFVHRELRNQGIGTELIRLLKKEVDHWGGLIIVVEPGGYDSNVKKLVEYYKRNGFAIGRVPTVNEKIFSDTLMWENKG